MLTNVMDLLSPCLVQGPVSFYHVRADLEMQLLDTLTRPEVFFSEARCLQPTVLPEAENSAVLLVHPKVMGTFDPVS